MVSIFKFKPAINALNLILFQTTCSLIRMYYNAWKRDTLQVLGKSLKLSQPQTGGGGGGGGVLPYISDGDACHKIQIKTLREINVGVAQA